jgi:hypothetical protein
MKHADFKLFILVISTLTLGSCEKDITTNKTDASSVANAAADASSGVVCTMTNAVSGNQLFLYKRMSNGSIMFFDSLKTGGYGTGAGLGSQGSIAKWQAYIYVCNAGSNEITVFKYDGSTLIWLYKVSSHGITPVSLTVHNGLLYALNAGGNGNITGFLIQSNGYLLHLPLSTKSLSSNASGPAQIEFNADGSQLVVTEKTTNLIDTWTVDANGLPGDLVTHASTGETPYGFGFGTNNTLIVSDAFGGATNASALSSYSVSDNGNVQLISGPVYTHQTAACWVAVTDDGKYAYTTNTGSNSVSGYSINSGTLILLNADGITGATGLTPIDLALSFNSRFLYSLNAGDGSITAFKVNDDGALTAVGSVSGIPAGAAGLTAR